MAIVQRFDIELPAFEKGANGTEVHTLTRAEAEALFADLAEALGTAPAGLADDVASLIGMVHSLHQLMEGPGHLAPYDEDMSIAPLGDGETMDIDAYLARQQALAQVGPPSAGGRNPGSGIGNTHVQ